MQKTIFLYFSDSYRKLSKYCIRLKFPALTYVLTRNSNLKSVFDEKKEKISTTTIRERCITRVLQNARKTCITNLLNENVNQLLFNTPFPNCIITTSLKILELFLRHSKNITEFSKNKSLKTQILRKKSCFDQIL